MTQQLRTFEPFDDFSQVSPIASSSNIIVATAIVETTKTQSGNTVIPGDPIYIAELKGKNEVPPVTTNASGGVQAALISNGTEFGFKIAGVGFGNVAITVPATLATGPTSAHIHKADGSIVFTIDPKTFTIENGFWV
ncbi:unnamed protein product, partial [marine sediment metagenome]